MDWNNKTWEDNELVNAQLMNDHIGGCFNFLYSPPAARVYNSAGISIPDASQHVLTFNSERFDNDEIHNLITNTSRLTCQTAGRYLITGHVTFNTNATGIRRLSIRVNGGTTIAQQSTSGYNPVSPQLTVSAVYDLVEGDYVELLAYQDSGGALSVLANGNCSPEFSMIRVG